MGKLEMREYDIRQVAAFKRTREKWGELSNMAGGFPVMVNGIHIRSVEALYQACRFPDMPEVQEKILLQTSPMTAKMVGKPFREHTREDWESVRVKIMKWSLRVKLAQNWERFSSVLLESENSPIVELSNKDDFWGAKPIDENIYLGVNALGRLLMELREQINHYDKSCFMVVPPLNIKKFNLYGHKILPVHEADFTQLKSPQSDMFDV